MPLTQLVLAFVNVIIVDFYAYSLKELILPSSSPLRPVLLEQYTASVDFIMLPSTIEFVAIGVIKYTPTTSLVLSHFPYIFWPIRIWNWIWMILQSMTF
jgi:hypothetical protein